MTPLDQALADARADTSTGEMFYNLFLNTPLFIQAQPHNLPLVLAQNGMLMDDRPHLPEPSDTRLPLLLVEEQDVGGQANHGRRVTWAWTGAWFERVREDVLLYVEDIRFHVPVYRDRWIASE